MGMNKDPRTIYEAFALALKSKEKEAEYWRSVAEDYEAAIIILTRQIVNGYTEKEEADGEG